MGKLQSYCLIYEPNLKLCITQLEKNVNKESQRNAFLLFVELMNYLKKSIHSVIKLYLPSTKPPVLHVLCPYCNATADPHIMLKEVTLNSRLHCTKTGPHLKLPPRSYLPFGDELSDDELFG